jgi:hypothetical protein
MFKYFLWPPAFKILVIIRLFLYYFEKNNIKMKLVGKMIMGKIIEK